jgi:formate C-acetyltransferase
MKDDSTTKNNLLNPWRNFAGDSWQSEINVRDFIRDNVTAYTGDESFLADATENTARLWARLSEMFKVEREKGVYDAETKLPTGVAVYGPGYIEKDLEKIVGLQTDAPLKRAIFPNGGIRVVESALESYGYKLDKETAHVYSHYRKTHNQGVFDAYTPDIRACRSSHIITGLPDAYGRGRIIGDYRRVALYGVDRLIAERREWHNGMNGEMEEDLIRLREEVAEQLRALEDLKTMAAAYGFDIGRPAATAQEAVQWTYFAYLGAVKDQDGAAMSLGRVSTFLDIYIERDLKAGVITESEAQEFIDHFVMKLRIVRFLRTPEYNNLFSGDPTWVTESIGGMSLEGDTLVTKNSFRFLHTLVNLGPAPEPNMTVLWSQRLPENWKKFCIRMSALTSAIQYENDDLMRAEYGDDYGIACCVSPMRIGKQMQFFGARVNLAKALTYAINGGKDEVSGKQVSPAFEAVAGDYLDYDDVWKKMDTMFDWLAGVYVKALNIIHYMHDKYAYEKLEMALHDIDVERIQATGIAGLSIVTDSLAAIKQTKVKVVRNEQGLVVDYQREGDYIAFGNNNNEVDQIAVDIVKLFMSKVRKHKTYRNAVATQSVLTITSNVVYGKATGNTPDGRRAGMPFAPGANPMHGRDTQGAVASMSSIAKLPFEHAHDGISYTFAIMPKALGKDDDNRIMNGVQLLDAYFHSNGGQHLNLNIFDRELLKDAQAHPEKYPQLTVRVSGYAVNFIKLTKEQQEDVISRTISEKM